MLLRAGRELMIPALVKWVDILLSKRKPTSDPRDPVDECTIVCRIVCYTLMHLQCLMKDAISLLVALEAGALKALLRAVTCYEQAREMEARSTLREQICEVVDRIACFIVYPSILHEFWRSVKGIKDLEILEGRIRSSSEVMWASWDRLVKKADNIRDFRRVAKETIPSLLCSNGEVGCRNRSRERKDQAIKRYLRCSSCYQAMYCSVECQRLHWKAIHQHVCKQLTQLRKANQPRWSDYDRLFFSFWIFDFKSANKEVIRLKIQLHRLQNRPKKNKTEDERLVDEDKKNPILVFDFNQPGLKPVDCISVLTTEKIKTDRRLDMSAASREAYIELWRSSRVREDEILVLGLFPRHVGQEAQWTLDASGTMVFDMVGTADLKF
ncbi:hypothetical protein PM082_024111 [Marasmius tenuissimus]|nr:hypothetical protein PM082_024111 [Marasmius tenuissimus]